MNLPIGSSNVLKNTSYIALLDEFKNWLETLGYAKFTAYNLPKMIKQYLLFLESKGKTELQAIDNRSICEYYYGFLQGRTNYRQQGGLSNAHLNKHLQALYRLCEFLRKSGRLLIPNLDIAYEKIEAKPISILSEIEINELFNMSELHQSTVLCYSHELRDKAILTAFYSLALRRNEVYHLDVSDFNFTKRIVYIRHGKNYKQRVIPFTEKSKIILLKYLYDARPRLLGNSTSQAFFISRHKKRMGSQSMAFRLKNLQKRSELWSLKDKRITPHILRHSLASHLLEKGMKIIDIAFLLGHSSLESTQIYTHLNQSNP